MLFSIFSKAAELLTEGNVHWTKDLNWTKQNLWWNWNGLRGIVLSWDGNIINVYVHAIALSGNVMCHPETDGLTTPWKGDLCEEYVAIKKQHSMHTCIATANILCCVVWRNQWAHLGWSTGMPQWCMQFRAYALRHVRNPRNWVKCSHKLSLGVASLWDLRNRYLTFYLNMSSWNRSPQPGLRWAPGWQRRRGLGLMVECLVRFKAEIYNHEVNGLLSIRICRSH